jgi:Zn-dependent M28 family amino/carboxypeptidase
MTRRCFVLVVLAACGSDPVQLPATDPASLQATLDALAGMGQKQAGTPASMMAAAYIQNRFTEIGLSNIHVEQFGFPRWELQSSSLGVTVDGVAMSPGYDVFESSGSGTASGEVVYVGDASDASLTGVDLTNKIAMVERVPSFHRSSQLRNVAAKGATAMLYLSIAPDNLRQVGSVRYDWESADPIPAITIGADDAATIKAAFAAQKPVTAAISVVATITPSTGTNVVGVIEGEVPEQVLCGAHYDTWFTGSSDNGSGIAELIEVAHRRVQRGKPHFTTVFVAYDGEEIGLYGGYDYNHKHSIVNGESILAVLNFESPSANDADVAGLAHSNQSKLDDALQRAHLRSLYATYTGLEVVPQLFGGIIPTDIQGDYRAGIPTASTAVTNPYYHTMADTPDKVDLGLLAESIDDFDLAITNLNALDPHDLAMDDPTLWKATVMPGATASIQVTDASGVPQANAIVKASVLVDDFTMSDRQVAMTDANGMATVTFTPGALQAGAGNRFLHVTAGPVYPLVEKIVALP